MSYIEIEKTESKGKTNVWEVKTKPRTSKGGRRQGIRYLGEVRWHGAWRGYAFFPYIDTLYEQKCMREIATFITRQTKKHREGWKKS